MPSLSVYLTVPEYNRLVDLARDEDKDVNELLQEFIRGQLKPKRGKA